MPTGRPVELVPGQATSGRLQSGDRIGLEVGYYDEWTFSADAGEHVAVTMDSDDVDAYLVVLLGDGTEVAYDDDSGTSLNARLEFVSAGAGQYTVLAASLFEEGTGQYSIQVDRWFDLQLSTVP